MREALDKLICAGWPVFMRRREDMRYGFEHDDGWFSLVDAVSETITGHAAAASLAVHEARQIKEELGGIRIYLRGQDDYVHGVVRFADAMSYRLCEITGRPGFPYNNGGRYQTLSPEQAGPTAKCLPDAPSLLAGATEPGVLVDRVRAVRADILPSGNLHIPLGWIDIADALLICLDGNLLRNNESCASRCVVTSLREDDGRLAVSFDNAIEAELGAAACAIALADRTERRSGASGPVSDDGIRP